MGTKIKLLLVEDDQPTADEFASFFAKLPSFHMLEVVDGATAAFRIIVKDAPSIVIVDISLREGDGIELIENIVSAKDLQVSPCIIVITAITTDAIHNKLYELGVSYIFGKDEPDFGPGSIAEYLIEIQDSLPHNKG
ncbi:MAG: response regulator [Oscillospiraceae bacterium]|nr:response regulator [Oscillospiraceae bacterium]